MRRITALVCAMLMSLVMVAPACIAAETDDVNVTDPGFEIVSTSPEDGDNSVAVDNFSIKMYFSKEMIPSSEEVRKSNAAQFTLTDEDGKKVPLKVYYSAKERKRGLMMVAADYSDNNKKNVQIKGASEYTLTIGDKLLATDGSRYNQTTTIKVKTLNQQRSMVVYMILMVLMMAGMVFFTVRSTKKAAEKEKEEKKKVAAVNPYKEAKKTGKSVEEIVAKDSKKKRKREEAEARQREAEAAIEAEIIEKIRRESNKRVSAPRAISSAGSTLKLKVVNDAGHKVDPAKAKSDSEAHKSNKGTTNPKGQSGKARNKKGKGKKKK